jgi:hypothetical protein
VVRPREDVAEGGVAEAGVFGESTTCEEAESPGPLGVAVVDDAAGAAPDGVEGAPRVSREVTNGTIAIAAAMLAVASAP